MDVAFRLCGCFADWRLVILLGRWYLQVAVCCFWFSGWFNVCLMMVMVVGCCDLLCLIMVLVWSVGLLLLACGGMLVSWWAVVLCV